jgi:hypothetical protein
MRIYVDSEFVEDGHVIELLSIGMVREDGDSLYLVNTDHGAISRTVNDTWLRENVAAHLPIRMWDRGRDSFGYRWAWEWDKKHPDYLRAAVHHRPEIARRVKDFIAATPSPQLWADFSAYDHVVYAQLFGRMADLPDGFPMATFDIQQEAARTCCDLSEPPVPLVGPEHNALSDALNAKAVHEYLMRRERDHLASSPEVMPFIWPHHEEYR